MAISSVSRIYDAPDPILETDLDLLAKVNQYKQMKYDAGAAEVQNEINNWAMLANVAKDQDREYINQKLNNLVNGITNAGGINLEDQNQVNYIKSLGFNIYGDKAAMNAVITTKKLRDYMADGQSKMSGKNSKNYDPTLYEYNLNKWNDWLNDGQVGTSFNGPTNLASGTFDQYQKRIADELSKLQPDMDSLPQGMTDAEKLNYLQVGNKFLSKDRVRAAIDTLTNSNDRELISAHAWRNMSGLPDARLVGLTTEGYNSKMADMQRQYNAIQDAKNQTQDISQKERYTTQLSQLTDAIGTIKNQRDNLVTSTAKGITEDQRRALRDNLYFDAFKEGYANTRAYTQSKTELKFNQAQAFKLKEARAAYEFSQRNAIDRRRLDLQEKGLELKQLGMMTMYGLSSGQLNANGVYGPAAQAPLQMIPVKGDDAVVLSNDAISAADANFAAQANAFYSGAYNYLGNNPAYQQYLVKNLDGNFVPIDEKAKAILDRAVNNKLGDWSKIANLPLGDRANLQLDDKETDMLKLSQNLQDAKIYQDQMRSLQNSVYQSLNMESPSTKKISISVRGGGTITTTYEKLKQMVDNKDPMLDQLQQQAVNEIPNTFYGIPQAALNDVYAATIGIVTGDEALAKANSNTSLTNAIRTVNDYYNNGKVKTKWEEVSQTLTPYGRNITLPKIKGIGIPPTLTSYLADKVKQANPSAAVNQEDVNLNKIWVKLNPSSENKVQYMAEIKYRKGNSSSGKKAEGDSYQVVDLTSDVINNPNNFISKLYPQDNAEVIYGFTLQNKGRTPFDPSNNYADALETTSNAKLAHKYQIVANKNNKNGLESFSVNVLIPRNVNGKTEFYTIPVKNFRNGGTTTFEPNYQYVKAYMNTYFQNDQAVQEFYRLHNIPIVTSPSTSELQSNTAIPNNSNNN